MSKGVCTPQQVTLQCRIALAALRGESNVRIARRLEITRLTVALWRGRVKTAGIGSLWQIASGRGRKPIYDQQRRDRIIADTLNSRPDGQSHWSCRTIAEVAQVS